MSDVYVNCSGPMFDGRAEAALERGIRAARDHVAAVGEKLTEAVFTASIRENTGHYLSRITTLNESKVVATRGGHTTYTMPIVVDPAAETVVTVDLATYGPWLEGTGSRNDTTRFKGYRGFRRTGQALNRVAGDLADAALKPYVEEMNR